MNPGVTPKLDAWAVAGGSTNDSEWGRSGVDASSLRPTRIVRTLLSSYSEDRI